MFAAKAASLSGRAQSERDLYRLDRDPRRDLRITAFAVGE
jgi:hypothetical protein